MGGGSNLLGLLLSTHSELVSFGVGGKIFCLGKGEGFHFADMLLFSCIYLFISCLGVLGRSAP